MTPIEYLHERFRSVNSALGETLRQDYGPGISSEYYEECEKRLIAIGEDIKNVRPADNQSISVYLQQLDYVSYWICLIERSQLGSFSWPFAFCLRRMAVALLSEKDLKGDLQKPLVHIVADGGGYLIAFEDVVPLKDAVQKFIVISFPRTLKHYVLLHTIFAHELGHAALHSEGCKHTLQQMVISPFVSEGPCRDKQALTNWLRHGSAPQEIKDQLLSFSQKNGADFEFNDEQYDSWIVELFCDLFGLVLFGPGFLAAHRTLLQTVQANPYECNLQTATHPPYAVRHRLLVDSFKILGWDTPITGGEKLNVYIAEKRFLNYLTNDNFSPWSNLISHSVLSSAIQSIQALFNEYPGLSYSIPSQNELSVLVDRLISRLPPLSEEISADGNPSFAATHVTHVMYAGWVYWLSRDNLSAKPLDYITINRLCDQAILQQEAVNRRFYAGLVK